MSIIKNIYYYFQSFFEILTFRHKSSYSTLSDIENQEEYESIILNNERMNR
jgi:hypothetical protein